MDQSDQIVIELLSILRRRPGTYLGDEEVRTLSTFLHGYLAGRLDAGDQIASSEALMEAFRLWLSTNGGEAPNLGWATIIEARFVAEHDDPPVRSPHRGSRTDGSARLFFALFGEFLASRGSAYLEAPEVGRRRGVGTCWK